MKAKTLIAAVLALAFHSASANEIKPLNGIAMEVNSGIITYSDIERGVRTLRANPSNQGIDDAQIVMAARQQLLERALLADAARAQNLKAGIAEVEDEIRRRAQVKNISVDELYRQQAALGWDATNYRLDVAKDLVLERLLAGIDEGVKIGDEQIDAHIAQVKHSGQALPQGEPYTVYTIRRIIQPIDQNNLREAVAKRINLIYQAVKQGNDFAALARRYSHDVAAANGGVAEVTDFSQSAKIEELLHSLQKGEMAMPVQTAGNWQIIQLLDKRTESDPVKIQREAVRRQLLQQGRNEAHAQFVGQLQQSAVIREF